MRNRISFVILILLSFAVSLAAVEIPQLGTAAPIMINVTGLVSTPGQYTLTNQHRISDAIAMANVGLKDETAISILQGVSLAGKDNAGDSLREDNMSLRQVVLQRNGQRSSYDLLRYYRMGDLSQNPQLKDGDMIYVPSLVSVVSISGMVNTPGDYEYIAGDKLSTIFEMAQGFRRDADLAKVRIYRYAQNMRDFETMELDLRAYHSDKSIADIALQAGDRILIPQSSEFRRSWTVKVEGRVVSPGEYVISESTTIYDILRLCGGPTVDGDLRTAVYLNQKGSMALEPELLRLKELGINQMTTLEYSYLRSKLRQLQGQYSVDLAQIWNSEGREGNLQLHDGDLIYIPEVMNVIWVSGQVRRPGGIPMVEGKNWQYYIQSAGGFASGYRSSKIRIIRGDSGNWIKPYKNLVLRPGDVIFVPENIERDLWTDVKDVLSIAVQLITVVVSVRALTQ